MSLKPHSHRRRSPTPESVAEQLHASVGAIVRLLRRVDAASGLRLTRLGALSVLANEGGRTLGELAVREQVSISTMSRIVKGLVAEHLVISAASPIDRRQLWIRATAKGKRVLGGAERRRTQTLASRLRHLTARELTELARSLDLLDQLIHEGWRPHGKDRRR